MLIEPFGLLRNAPISCFSIFEITYTVGRTILKGFEQYSVNLIPKDLFRSGSPKERGEGVR